MTLADDFACPILAGLLDARVGLGFPATLRQTSLERGSWLPLLPMNRHCKGRLRSTTTPQRGGGEAPLSKKGKLTLHVEFVVVLFTNHEPRVTTPVNSSARTAECRRADNTKVPPAFHANRRHELLSFPSGAFARTVTAPRGVIEATPSISNTSCPVRPSDSRVSPDLNSSGSTPMPTRLLL